MYRPKARSESLIVERLPGELLVYDETRARAHCLNGPAAFVWERCDGRTSVSEISTQLRESLGLESGEEVVQLALQRLSRTHLLDESVRQPGPPISRREMARRLGIAVALLPAVASIVSPQPAHAASCVPRTGCCNSKPDCCPGLNCEGPPTAACTKRCF